MDLEVEDITDKVRFSAGQIGDIVFENISFRYGTQTNVFEHFKATFKKGNVSAIVGESGSGKTTLAALMQNLYPPFRRTHKNRWSGLDTLTTPIYVHWFVSCLKRLICSMEPY